MTAILEVSRIYADWLSGATLDFQGKPQDVNTWLQAIPRDAADPIPARVTRVLDVTRSHELASGILQCQFPVLAVMPNGPFVTAGEVQTIYRDAPTYVQAVRYLAKDYERADAVRDGLYTMRAVMASLRQFMRNENEAAWTRNSVAVLASASMTVGPAFQAHGDYATVAALLVTMKVRDLAP